MSNLARQQMYYGRFTTTEEIVEAVDCVTAADIQRVAQSLFQSELLSLTLLGNLGNLSITPRRPRLLACIPKLLQ